LSNDGGSNWSTGISATGINANNITTGQLNTSVINILNGHFPSFRWDENGLSAFAFSINDSGQAVSFNTSKFIRYDQYGLYGINNYPNFNPNEIENGIYGEEKIWANASFALT
jgi:hypothetical protein